MGGAVAFIRTWIVWLVISFLTPTAFGQDRAAEKKEIWQLETAYWEYIKKGDAAGFSSLWHEEAMVWPQGLPSPIGKSAVEKLMLDQTSLKLLTYNLNLQAINFFENVAVVYYWYNLITADKIILSGRMEHIWIKKESKWRIIGGFSGGANTRE